MTASTRLRGRSSSGLAYDSAINPLTSLAADAAEIDPATGEAIISSAPNADLNDAIKSFYARLAAIGVSSGDMAKLESLIGDLVTKAGVVGATASAARPESPTEAMDAAMKSSARVDYSGTGEGEGRKRRGIGFGLGA